MKLSKTFSSTSPKLAPNNRRVRVQYKTDAENEYFDRDSDRGIFILNVDNEEIKNFSLNLWNGVANLNIELPNNVNVHNILYFNSKVSDVNRIDPFTDEFFIEVGEKVEKQSGTQGKRRLPSSNKKGDEVEKTSFLDLPNEILVYRDDWDKHDFNRETALSVVDSGSNG